MERPNSWPSIVERPLVRFGREVCGDLSAALRREWLVTNGIGGYASGTVAGVATRRYHGLLVAALEPPVGRTVLVGGTMEWAVDGDVRVPLSTHALEDGTVEPQGFCHLESFHLDGMLPVWRYALGDAIVERRVWMAEGSNTTFLRFRLERGEHPVRIDVRLLLTDRDFHSLATPEGRAPVVASVADSSIAILSADGHPVHARIVEGSVRSLDQQTFAFLHREECARGLDDRSELVAAATVELTLRPERNAGLMLSVEPIESVDLDVSLVTAQQRQARLLVKANALDAHPMVQQLTLAADQFLVDRPPSGRTVIAGYHWFNDWGRDTMIALPGLTLSTGRPEEAAAILRAFAPHVRDGLLPNNFPDRAGADPGYNTVDASLWYFVAVGRYLDATGDRSLLDDLLPVLREIVDRHVAGTRYSIGMDPADGLLRAGEPGVQLTWMDAKVGDWVITPRIGKAVEINALWYNALRYVAAWTAGREDEASQRYTALAERVRASFRARFVRADLGYLTDVVDGPEADELRLRPNQLFAISLPYPLVEGSVAAEVLEAVGRWLVTSYGVRSLAPFDADYRGDYGGDQVRRDSGYHQGPVWTWLIGAFVEAHLRVHGKPDLARSFLAPFEDHLRDAGLGTVSEILEGDPPFAPRGAIAQAWGVAEVLRAWRAIDAAASRAPRARPRK